MRAYVLISTSAGHALTVAQALAGTSGVKKADPITGEYDVIAEIEAADIASVGQLVVEKIQAQEGVFKTITCLVVQ